MKKKGVSKEYRVPARVTYYGAVFVTATSADDAVDKVNKGAWDADEFGGLYDWEITGPAEENK